ncbi:DUF642 domain-containing protein [Aetokthonos hydrillicola]
MLTKLLNVKIAVALALSILPMTLSIKPAAAAGNNILQNGSFEDTVVANKSYGLYPSISGWNLLSGSIGTRIEVQNNVAGTPLDGNNLVELDSNGVTGIYQDLATIVGRTYQLQFGFSPRAGIKDNRLNINWGNNLVANLTADGTGLKDTKWQLFTYNLVATSAITRLSFDNLNELSDTYGTYIDKVSVRDIPETSPFIGLLAFGFIGGVMLRRKQQKALPQA